MSAWEKGASASPAHLWKKGQSGNPGGRPRLTEVQLRAREFTTVALETLVTALSDRKQCVQAAIAILDRGWGKPAQAITGPDGASIRSVIEVVTGVPAKLDEAEAQAEAEAHAERSAFDAEFERGFGH